MEQLLFRKDINGLRAIGVLAVIIYHFNAAWLPGGFAGVDIFFVISGYLMTKLIVSGLTNREFSLTRFYFSRARRIIPALAMLCLALLILGWFTLAPGDYNILARHIEKSVTFTSNVTYLQESGYFDLASHKKWLLHTWSLSIEWQFYLLYPIALLFFNRIFGLKSLRWIIVIATIVSFILAVFQTHQTPSAAFFLLPYRAWELMLGGVVFLFPVLLKTHASKCLEYLGLIAVLSSLIFISSNYLWPGVLAVIPVFGAAAILTAHRNNSFFTSNIVSQKLGNISYSLYLWHWPVYAVIYYFEYQHNVLIVLLGIAASFVLGTLSYYSVERRSLFKESFLSIKTPHPLKEVAVACISVPVLMILVVFCATKFVRNSNGAASRIDNYIFDNPHLFQKAPAFSWQCHENAMDLPQCVLADAKSLTKDQPDFILMGDSHADVVSTAIAQANANVGGNGVLLFTKGGCLFIPDIRNTNKPQDADCSTVTNKIIQIIQQKYPKTPVILVNRLNYYFNVPRKDNRAVHFAFIAGKQPENYSDKEIDRANLDVSNAYLDMVCSLAEQRDVFILKPTPEFDQNVVDQIAKTILLKQASPEVTVNLESYYQHNNFVLAMLEQAQSRCGAKLIDPLPALCDSDKCYGLKGGLPLYQDDNHLNEYGNKLLIPIFEKVMQSEIKSD